MLIKAGSTLLVARADAVELDVSEHLADNGMLVFAPDSTMVRRVLLRAGRRDSVASIARRYRLTPESVAQWNATEVGAPFRAGQKVTVFVAAKPVATKAVRRKAGATSPTLRVAPAKPVPLTQVVPRLQVAKR
jgi:membrane-bound lytic murein transglycosylase D